MANIFKRIWQNLDFWDQDENKRQNAEMDREDEEEKKRKREQERNSYGAPKAVQPTIRQQADALTLKPAPTIGSQSDTLFTQKLQKVTPADPRTPAQKELDKMAFDKLDEAKREQERGQNWFEKNLWGRSGNADRAAVSARGKALTAYQEKYDPNFERELAPDVKAYQEDTMGRTNAGSKKAQKTIQDTKTAVDVMRFIPGAGLGELGANVVRGNFSGSREADDTLLREQFDLTPAEVASLSQEDRDKYIGFAKAGVGAGVLDVVGVGAGGLAKAGGKQGVKKTIQEGIKATLKKSTAKEVAEDIFSREGLKAVAKNSGVGAGAGAVIGGGGTVALGGDEEDAIENAVSGAVGGAFGGLAQSPFDSAVKLTKAGGKQTAEKTARTLVEAQAAESADAIQKATNRAARKAEVGPVPSTGETPDVATPSVEVAPGVKSTNLAKDEPTGLDVPNPQGQPQTAEPLPEIPTQPAAQPVNIPDPADPIALGRADNVALEVPRNDQVMADFDNAMEAPLVRADAPEQAVADVQPTQTDIAEDVQAGELPQAFDEAGNPIVRTDAQVAQELENAGLAPDQQASVVATEADELAAQADAATRAEVNLDDTSAPEVRERLLNRIDDDEVADDLMTNAPRKETINLEEAKVAGVTKVREWDDAQLVDQFEGGRKIDGPEDFYTNVSALSRLEKISREGLDEASVRKLNDAQRNAFESIADYAEASGRGLRTVQVLFDDMPKTMKVEYLMKKLNNALPGESDAVRMELTGYIDAADAATDTLRNLETTVQKQLADIENGAFQPSPESLKQLKQLAEDTKIAQRNKELRAGEAYKFWKSKMPKGNLGKELGQWGRTLMLSSPGGRVFDLISTASTFFDDLLTQGVSAGIGKIANKVKGAGTVIDTGPNAGQIAAGTREGFSDTFGKNGSLKGGDRVDDFMGAAKRSSRGDTGDLNNPIANTIRAFVELPTNASRGMFNNKLYAQGVQEAEKLGLTGADAETYGMLRAVVPSTKQLEVAKDAHMRVNMLHENGISRGLNRVAASLDNSGKTSWMTPLIRNQIAPFTSWLGGNLNRTLTDKNVAYNAFDIVRQLNRGETQAAVDSMAKLAVNSGEAFAIGTLLTQAGILTTQNETADEGDDYAGVYIHIGDRYIPVGILGTAAVPLILGNATSEAMNSDGDFVENVMNLAGNALVNTGKNAGVASVFGGENNLQKTTSELFTDNGGDVQDEVFNPLVKAAGNVGRQYIPAITGDVNALLDYSPFNPTNEAAKTKVTFENPETGREKTDVMASEFNKTLSKIPFASQALEREEGKAAKDTLDKVLKSSRGTPAQETEKAKTLSDAEVKKAREKDEIPDTDDAIKARWEDGDFDAAIAGYQQKYDDIKDDEDVPKSKKEEIQRDKTRLEITRDGGFTTEDIALYSKISLSEWRKLADPDDSEYDPDLAGRLAEYDKRMAAAGVSRDEDDTKDTKYYLKGDGSKRGGKAGGSGKKMSTDIATNKQSFDNFTPLKAEKAGMTAPKSSIPEVAKAPNYSRKLKKISVTRGGRA